MARKWTREAQPHKAVFYFDPINNNQITAKFIFLEINI